jgi:cytochrome c
MKKVIVANVLGLAAIGVQMPAHADGADVAREQGCLRCHDVDKKKVGPAFKDVAAKYQGKKVDEAVAGMKAKSVHTSFAEKAGDQALAEILEWVLKR